MQKHLTITVSGKVQGVSFRAATKQMADLLGVKGYVMNLANGSVIVAAEGEEEWVHRLVDWCHHGPEHAVVEKLSVQEGVFQKFAVFEIKRN